MKQKRIEDTLYVFDVNPYTITEDTDASIIKVQQETYEGFIELNPDLADKIVKYNYHMFTVNKQAWADYVDAEEPAKKYLIKTYPALSVGFVGYVNGEVTWLDQAQIWEDDVVGGNQLGQFAYCEAGTPFQINANDCGIISATPELSLSEDRLWELGPSYIMPNSDVELQLFEMPSENTEFEFNIFDSMESTESTASGTATWKGLYIGGIASDLSSGLYVTVRANGQFTEGTLIEEMPLFIQTVDVYPLISGERVEVRSIVEGTTETGVLGYIKFPG